MKLMHLREKMMGLQSRSKRIAEMVMFCLDNKRKMEIIISAYCQLVQKKKELGKELEDVAFKLVIKKPELEQ